MSQDNMMMGPDDCLIIRVKYNLPENVDFGDPVHADLVLDDFLNTRGEDWEISHQVEGKPSRETLEQLPRLSQRQDSTEEQLKDLRWVANRLGMYDAGDAIKGLVQHEQ
jgi:hypothetical protein